MSDLLFLLGLLLPPAIVVAGFVSLLAPLQPRPSSRSLPRLRVSRTAQPLSH